MTEDKRFTFMQDTLVKADVFDGEEFVCCTLSVWAEQLVDKLNGLNDENEQLKMANNSLKLLVQNWEALDEEKDEQLDKQNQVLKKLKKENEQLKQFKEKVFDKINMHLRMLPTAKNNEFNEYDGDASLYTGAIYILETLKKELEE